MTAAAWAVVDSRGVVRDVAIGRDGAEVCLSGREREHAGEFRIVPLGVLAPASADALAAVTEAVRVVEDAIDATSERAGSWTDGMVPTDRTGLAVVEALVEAGWLPPAPAPWLGVPGELCSFPDSVVCHLHDAETCRVEPCCKGCPTFAP